MTPGDTAASLGVAGFKWRRRRAHQRSLPAAPVLNHTHPPGSQIGSRGVRSVTVRRRAAAAAIAVGRRLAGRHVHGIENHAFLSACSVAESADESAAPARQQTPQSGPHENALPSTNSLWPPGAQPGPGPLYTIPPLCKAFYCWCVVLLPVAAGDHAEHPRGNKKGRSSATGAGNEQSDRRAHAVADSAPHTSVTKVALEHCQYHLKALVQQNRPKSGPLTATTRLSRLGPRQACSFGRKDAGASLRRL